MSESVKARYEFTVKAGSRAELSTAIWEEAWAFFGDDESAETPAVLKIVHCHVTREGGEFVAKVIAQGQL